MRPPHGTSLETLPSLLRRLQSGDDIDGWNDFYRSYGGLIRFFAQKAGLTTDEAEEVVQETVIGVARRLPEFVYDPKVCRFKTWLLNLTRWRIQDQLRRRRALGRGREVGVPEAPQKHRGGQFDQTDETPTVERIPDPTVPEFGSEWDAAWKRNLLAQALERVRHRIDERQFKILDLCITKAWPAADVAQTLRISVARVYMIKHRVAARVKNEVRKIEKLPVWS